MKITEITDCVLKDSEELERMQKKSPLAKICSVCKEVYNPTIGQMIRDKDKPLLSGFCSDKCAMSSVYKPKPTQKKGQDYDTERDRETEPERERTPEENGADLSDGDIL